MGQPVRSTPRYSSYYPLKDKPSAHIWSGLPLWGLWRVDNGDLQDLSVHRYELGGQAVAITFAPIPFRGATARRIHWGAGSRTLPLICARFAVHPFQGPQRQHLAGDRAGMWEAQVPHQCFDVGGKTFFLEALGPLGGQRDR